MLLKTFLCILAAVSAVAFLMYGIDKWKAKRGAWRIPEKTLMLLSFIGGGAAMYITMLLIRHKTKHVKFMVGIPLIIIAQIAAAAAVVYFLYF